MTWEGWIALGTLTALLLGALIAHLVSNTKKFAEIQILKRRLDELDGDGIGTIRTRIALHEQELALLRPVVPKLIALSNVIPPIPRRH